MIEKLLVCFIPGMDYRRISKAHTPFIHSLITKFPSASVGGNFSTADIIPTLLTGVYPPEHRWEVSLKPEIDKKLLDKFIDLIPDTITTTFQCFIHLFKGSYDLATVPPRRRRLFEIKRTKYMKKRADSLLKFGEFDSILKIIGEDRCIYISVNRFNKLKGITDKLLEDTFRLEIFELYALNILEQWYHDKTDRLNIFLEYIDRFLKELYEKCRKTNTTLLIFSDHGHDIVTGTINLTAILNNLNLKHSEYCYFIEAFRARFWIHTEKARKKIVEILSSIENGSVITKKDIEKYNLKFHDDRFGEFFFIADPGYIIFPHDFYNPLVNLFLGLKNWEQRSRIFNPVQRGYHHYLPSNDSEKGFMILSDDRFRSSGQEIEIIDFAPTILSLLGYKQPPWMKGHAVFKTQNHNS